jgi:ornithine carbamoyltransferase
MPKKRDLLSVTDLTADETHRIIRRAADGKISPAGHPLAGKSVALLFEKPSLRTRVSFEVGIQQLGGYSLSLGQQEVGMGSREPVADVAKVLSGYVDCIIARVFDHRSLEELAKHAAVPVINALSDVEHPCQIMADLLTVYEHKGGLDGLTLTYVGDGNNVARSLCLALPALGMNFSSASPDGFGLDRATLDAALHRANGNGAAARIFAKPAEAVADADVVYTDVWTSMGQEDEVARRNRAFEGYTVTPELMAKARPGALFMHDMPAHYGEEVAPGMLDHPQSVAFPQAHNRLHAQKAVLEFLLAED